MKIYGKILPKLLTALLLAAAGIFGIFLFSVSSYSGWSEEYRYLTNDRKHGFAVYGKYDPLDMHGAYIKIEAFDSETGRKKVVFKRKCSFKNGVAWYEFSDISVEISHVKVNDYHSPWETEIVWSKIFR